MAEQQNPTPSDSDVQRILSTIKQVESSGNYEAKAKGSSASGAYQFINDTWQRSTKRYGIGTEYKTAAEAPPEVQDAVAARAVRDILDQVGGDVTKVPLVWYTGNPQGRMTEEALRVNRGLTPDKYQQKWLSVFNKGSPTATMAAQTPAQPVTQAPRTMAQATPVVAAAKPSLTDMPAAYRMALAANYLADTESPETSVVERAMEMLNEQQGGAAKNPLAGYMQAMGEESVNPFQFVQQEQEEPRRRAVPRLPVRMEKGGAVDKDEFDQQKEQERQSRLVEQGLSYAMGPMDVRAVRKPSGYEARVSGSFNQVVPYMDFDPLTGTFRPTEVGVSYGQMGPEGGYQLRYGQPLPREGQRAAPPQVTGQYRRQLDRNSEVQASGYYVPIPGAKDQYGAQFRYVQRFSNGGEATSQDASAQLVQQAYRDILQKAPDAEGLAYWTSQLVNRNLNAENLYENIAAAAQNADAANAERYASALQNKNLVTKTYQDILNRTPDQEGMSYWIGQLNTGALKPEDLRQNLLSAAQGADQANAQRYATNYFATEPQPIQTIDPNSYRNPYGPTRTLNTLASLYSIANTFIPGAQAIPIIHYGLEALSLGNTIKKIGRVLGFAEGGQVVHRQAGSPQQGEIALRTPSISEVPQVDVRGRVIRDVPVPQPTFTPGQQLIGAGETALSALSGLTAPASIAYDVLRGVPAKEVSPSRFMYEPRTEAGQETLQNVGRLAQEYKLDVAMPQVQLQRPYPVGAAARQGIAGLEKGVEKMTLPTFRQLTGNPEATKEQMMDFVLNQKSILQAGAPAISRAPGGTFFTSEGSNLQRFIGRGANEALDEIGDDPEKAAAVSEMFYKKAQDFFEKRAGSISDELKQEMLAGRIKMPGEIGEELFPKYLREAAQRGDISAMRDIERRYDEMLGIKQIRLAKENLTETYAETQRLNQATKQSILAQFKQYPELIPDDLLFKLTNKDPTDVRIRLKDNPEYFSTVLEPKLTKLINIETEIVKPSDILNYESTYGRYAAENLSKNELEAIKRNKPLLDIKSAYQDLFGYDITDLARQAAKMSTKELQDITFATFVSRASKLAVKQKTLEARAKEIQEALKANKSVDPKALSFGTEVFQELPDGFTWRKIVDPDATVIQSAVLDNSISGYSRYGAYGPFSNGRKALENGDVELFVLYDKNGIPVTNVEMIKGQKSGQFSMRQAQGNGPLTSNVTPDDYLPQLKAFINKTTPTDLPFNISREIRYIDAPEGFAKGGIVDKPLYDRAA